MPFSFPPFFSHQARQVFLLSSRLHGFDGLPLPLLFFLPGAPPPRSAGRSPYSQKALAETSFPFAIRRFLPLLLMRSSHASKAGFSLDRTLPFLCPPRVDVGVFSLCAKPPSKSFLSALFLSHPLFTFRSTKPPLRRFALHSHDDGRKDSCIFPSPEILPLFSPHDLSPDFPL